jgi:hypothetical protein
MTIRDSDKTDLLVLCFSLGFCILVLRFMMGLARFRMGRSGSLELQFVTEAGGSAGSTDPHALGH